MAKRIVFPKAKRPASSARRHSGHFSDAIHPHAKSPASFIDPPAGLPPEPDLTCIMGRPSQLSLRPQEFDVILTPEQEDAVADILSQLLMGQTPVVMKARAILREHGATIIELQPDHASQQTTTDQPRPGLSGNLSRACLRVAGEMLTASHYDEPHCDESTYFQYLLCSDEELEAAIRDSTNPQEINAMRLVLEQRKQRNQFFNAADRREIMGVPETDDFASIWPTRFSPLRWPSELQGE